MYKTLSYILLATVDSTPELECDHKVCYIHPTIHPSREDHPTSVKPYLRSTFERKRNDRHIKTSGILPLAKSRPKMNAERYNGLPSNTVEFVRSPTSSHSHPHRRKKRGEIEGDAAMYKTSACRCPREKKRSYSHCRQGYINREWSDGFGERGSKESETGV